MAGIPKVTLQPAQWSESVTADLARIERLSERDVCALQLGVVNDDFQLLELEVDGQRAGLVIWSVCKEADGYVLVVNALAADPVPDVDMTARIFELFCELGRATGAVALRAFSARDGMARKLGNLGGVVRSYVVEVPLDGR